MSAMEAPLCIIDAFTDKPFSGNSAAICWIQENDKISDKMMQSIASEMNLSETAFITSNNFSSAHEFGLRWFTPTNEVPLCGHATLASAASIFHFGKNMNDEIVFSTLSGNLFARKKDDFIIMDFPSNKPTQYKEDLSYLYPSIFQQGEKQMIESVWLSNTTKKLIIKMNGSFTRENLEDLKPDITSMHSKHDGNVYKGVIVTANPANDDSYDFISRYFAPWNGIPEDPVTGSAHTVLGPLWGEILNKTNMRARQCSKRGGDVSVTLRNDGRIDIAGKYAVVMNGTINIPHN